MDSPIHVWSGPEKSLASGCSATGFTITMLTEKYAEGEITVKDHIENGIVFSDPWEAVPDGCGGWVAKRKNNNSSFWKDSETGEVCFTANGYIDEAIKKFISKRINIFITTGKKLIGPDDFRGPKVNKEGAEIDQEMLNEALQEDRLFKIGYSFLFAVQVPDDSVGISGSRCSNCDNEVAYCNQRCIQCGFPFIGPFGFPQFILWKTLSSAEKRIMVEDIYANHGRRGRLGYTNVEFVPLTKDELKKIEKLKYHHAEYFLSTHAISPQEIKKTLLE